MRGRCNALLLIRTHLRIRWGFAENRQTPMLVLEFELANLDYQSGGTGLPAILSVAPFGSIETDPLHNVPKTQER